MIPPEFFPELFSSELTEKAQEIVIDRVRHGNIQKSRSFYQTRLKEAFEEISRVLKDEGIACVLFTHKSTLLSFLKSMDYRFITYKNSL